MRTGVAMSGTQISGHLSWGGLGLGTGDGFGGEMMWWGRGSGVGGGVGLCGRGGALWGWSGVWGWWWGGGVGRGGVRWGVGGWGWGGRTTPPRTRGVGQLRLLVETRAGSKRENLLP